MQTPQIRNVIVPLVTPSKTDDFLPLIDHVLGGGLEDFVLFGTTGEGEKIDVTTKKSVIRNIVPFIDGRARLYIGLICSTFIEAVHLANFCHEHGFEGALLPPHLYGDDPFAIVSEFLARSSSKFFLYNPPGAKPIEKIVRSLEETRIIGLKDSSGDIEFIKYLTTLPRPISYKLYYGREHLLDEALKLDIDGIFPGTGNISPQLLLRLWKQRDAASFKLFYQLKDQIRASCPENYIRGLKIHLKNLGIING
jgi:4-hydroxy-tetrahydrodipicolinate synthase